MGVAAFEIRNRAELVDALSVAAQVEHIVLVEYLYAAFSCRHTQDPSLPTSVQMASWDAARALYKIAHSEMDHLGVVQQLLAALGAPPVPDAWTLPIRDDARLPFAAEPPDPIRFDVLGDLYRAIIAGLRRLGDAVFVGAKVTGRQPSPLSFVPHPVATAADAIASLTTVISEGEGATGSQPSGHWQRFLAMGEALGRLGPEVDLVSWPCVANPVLRDSGVAGTTLLTDRSTVAVADIANRAYRGLWLLLGGTYVHDWSASDSAGTKGRRKDQQLRSMTAARLVMATVLRPLGEILARLPAFEGDPEGPTAGMGFEQYGEFRTPAQPDARLAATADELAAVAVDLDVAAVDQRLSAPWAGPRLGAMAADVREIRERFLGRTESPPRKLFEPPAPGQWLSVDFSGWYQVRLGTGGDPYNERRGVSGWQFAFAGEPDMDRVLRFQPEGTFLRPHVDPAIKIGVTVTSAVAGGGAPLQALAGARVELVEDAKFEGHNGAVAADGDEPIVPLCLRITAEGVVLQRHAADSYVVPYLNLVSLGQAADLAEARSLREEHGLPGTGAELPAHLTKASNRLQAAIADAKARGDAEAALVLERRLGQIGNPAWPFLAVVVWRLRLDGSDCVARTPRGVQAPATDSPWWLELFSTGFDPDAGCALVRGVLHAPIGANAGPAPWKIALAGPESTEAAPGMPVDAMGVRLGR